MGPGQTPAEQGRGLCRPRTLPAPGPTSAATGGSQGPCWRGDADGDDGPAAIDGRREVSDGLFVETTGDRGRLLRRRILPIWTPPSRLPPAAAPVCRRDPPCSRNLRLMSFPRSLRAQFSPRNAKSTREDECGAARLPIAGRVDVHLRSRMTSGDGGRIAGGEWIGEPRRLEATRNGRRLTRCGARGGPPARPTSSPRTPGASIRQDAGRRRREPPPGPGRATACRRTRRPGA